MFAFDGVFAQPQNKIFQNSGLPIPRFVSLASDKVFVRTGPALRYPIAWVYQRDAMPVEVIQEFDTWRKIKDIDGDEGWVHQSLLKGARTAIVQTDQNIFLRQKPNDSAQKIVELEPQVQVALKRCEGAWCDVNVQQFNGWIERKTLWGVYDHEEFQ